MDISSLRERRDTSMTVSELNVFIKNMFDSNRLLANVYVRGEISNFVNHRSGHLYFTLKDEEGQIRGVMFRSSAIKLKFIPENGMKVTVCGSITVYPRDGSYQIYVTSMQPDGIGALYLAYEQLKNKLEAEGLFSELHKKFIPEFPKKIGVITSPTGAAVRDIINVIGRRYPLAELYLYPALVQGDGAVETLIAGIDYFDKSRLVDTVIIGRGGGSIEDLWAFNSEKLARRIFDCNVPVISAVGHETDFTICDFVSDMRAPTPSAAAELSVPDIREVVMRIDSLSDRADRSLNRITEKYRERVNSLICSPVLKKPEKIIEPLRQDLNSLSADLQSLYTGLVVELRHTLGENVAKLEALNPLSVLSRGYSVLTKNNKTISSVDLLKNGDIISIRLKDGSVEAITERIVK